MFSLLKGNVYRKNWILTLSGAIIQRHLSKVINAVMQLDTCAKAKCGIAKAKCWNSIGSNGKSEAMIAGVKLIFIHITVSRQNKSAIAKPVYNVQTFIKHS
jgi:hypothetical protein